MKATGGGSFCKKLADAVNKENSQSAARTSRRPGMKATFTNGL